MIEKQGVTLRDSMDHFLVQLLAFRKDLSFLLSYLVSAVKTKILLVGCQVC